MYSSEAWKIDSRVESTTAQQIGRIADRLLDRAQSVEVFKMRKAPKDSPAKKGDSVQLSYYSPALRHREDSPFATSHLLVQAGTPDRPRNFELHKHQVGTDPTVYKMYSFGSATDKFKEITIKKNNLDFHYYEPKTDVYLSSPAQKHTHESLAERRSEVASVLSGLRAALASQENMLYRQKTGE